MGKVRNLDEAMEKYKSSGGSAFFKLENDKDTAPVRFLYAHEEDVDAYVVHETEINGKRRWVSCTERGDCPLCVSGNRPVLKLFIQLFDERDGKVKLWERSQKYIPLLRGLIGKYGTLFERPCEVERNGKKGDTKTTYQVYVLDKDGKTEKDFPERTELLNGHDGFILELTSGEMEDLLNGKFQFRRSENSNRGTAQPANRTSGAGAQGTTTRQRATAEVF